MAGQTATDVRSGLYARGPQDGAIGPGCLMLENHSITIVLIYRSYDMRW